MGVICFSLSLLTGCTRFAKRCKCQQRHTAPSWGEREGGIPSRDLSVMWLRRAFEGKLSTQNIKLKPSWTLRSCIDLRCELLSSTITQYCKDSERENLSALRLWLYFIFIFFSLESWLRRCKSCIIIHNWTGTLSNAPWRNSPADNRCYHKNSQSNMEKSEREKVWKLTDFHPAHTPMKCDDPRKLLCASDFGKIETCLWVLVALINVTWNLQS